MKNTDKCKPNREYCNQLYELITITKNSFNFFINRMMIIPPED